MWTKWEVLGGRGERDVVLLCHCDQRKCASLWESWLGVLYDKVLDTTAKMLAVNKLGNNLMYVTLVEMFAVVVACG